MSFYGASSAPFAASAVAPAPQFDAANFDASRNLYAANADPDYYINPLDDYNNAYSNQNNIPLACNPSLNQSWVWQGFVEGNNEESVAAPSEYEIYNSDQMGLQLEMASGRTLAFKGEKQVQAAVQSKNAITHSLTTQPLICADAKFILLVMVCFYEANGAPDCFVKDLKEFENLYCVWTKSGNVTSEIMKKWMKNIFLEYATTKYLLLVDYWSGYNQAKEMPEVKKKKISIVTIPKKTTGKIQPLDVGHNRYTKAFYRTMSDKIRRVRPGFVLSQRRSIARLLNQTYEQFAAPRFESLIQHSFIKSGYFKCKYDEYQTPEEYCFNFSKVGARCEIYECAKYAFIRCTRCEKYLCIDDFLMKLHCCRKNN